MTRRYRYGCTIPFGHDGEPGYSEVEIEVSYAVAWGSSEAGRNGPPEHYDPGCGDMVEDIKLELVEGKPRPWDMGYGYISDDDFAADCVEKIEGDKYHYEAMVGEAAQEDAAARDSYLEQEWKDSRSEYGGPQDAEDPNWF